jgi:hypothetical protein
MNLKPIHYFLGGVALTALIAAAKFVGGTPLDQTFTYQGQLRNAGQLVSGPVDLKISMWDADTGGSQVGSTNTFNAMQLNDGGVPESCGQWAVPGTEPPGQDHGDALCALCAERGERRVGL